MTVVADDGAGVQPDNGDCEYGCDHIRWYEPGDLVFRDNNDQQILDDFTNETVLPDFMETGLGTEDWTEPYTTSDSGYEISFVNNDNGRFNIGINGKMDGAPKATSIFLTSLNPLAELDEVGKYVQVDVKITDTIGMHALARGGISLSNPDLRDNHVVGNPVPSESRANTSFFKLQNSGEVRHQQYGKWGVETGDPEFIISYSEGDDVTIRVTRIDTHDFALSYGINSDGAVTETPFSMEFQGYYGRENMPTLPGLYVGNGAGPNFEVSFDNFAIGTVTFDAGGFADYDNDGTWNLGDLNLVLFNWQQNEGSLPAQWVNQRPAAVDLDSLNQVLFNWQQASSPATVPEPTSGLLLMGLLAVVTQRRGCPAEENSCT